jgi:hypothetical protein
LCGRQSRPTAAEPLPIAAESFSTAAEPFFTAAGPFSTAATSYRPSPALFDILDKLFKIQEREKRKRYYLLRCSGRFPSEAVRDPLSREAELLPETGDWLKPTPVLPCTRYW